MQQPRRATLKDVAEASRVSTATVSFVLNDTPGQTIPESTRERVQDAARRLRYSPHRVARTLREGTSRTVVLILGNLNLRGSGNLDGFIRGMRGELEANGHALVVLEGSGSDASSTEFLETVAPRAVLDLARPYEDGAALSDGGWTDGLAAHAITQLGYLIGQGHTRIALAAPSGSQTDRIVALRMRHLRQAAEREGLIAPHVVRVAATPRAARRSLALLRERHPGVTAVAAFDDETALRVLAAMADLGLAAPQDLAVIGFDDSPYGRLWRPALTTVHIDAEAFGRRAARTALGLENEARVSPPSHVIARDTA